MSVIGEADGRPLQFPPALHKDLVVAVDQDVPDGGVVEQRLQGTVSQQLVPDLFAEALLIRHGQSQFFLGQDDLDTFAQSSCRMLSGPRRGGERSKRLIMRK
jgi:hypothetical protein